MKTRLLMILAFGLFSSSLLSVYAVPEPDPEAAFRFSEIVIVGKILSLEILSEPQITKTEKTYSEISGVALYEIQIEEYLKNPSDVDIVTVTGYFLRVPHPMAYETYPYDVDQRVLLYLSKNNNANTATDLIIGTANSRVIDNGLCDLGSYFEKGLCVIIDDSTNVPDPPCKSGPSPGDNFVFVDCNWVEITCGLGTELIDNQCVPIKAVKADSQPSRDCLIATASYGSELAPQVQMLREIRDNVLLSTDSGVLFMEGFNTVYYSFSPEIAQLEEDNPMFKEAVKIFITPMVSTLSIMTLVDEGSEPQVIIFGISTIGLIVGMYVVAPVVLVWKVGKRK